MQTNQNNTYKKNKTQTSKPQKNSQLKRKTAQLVDNRAIAQRNKELATIMQRVQTSSQITEQAPVQKVVNNTGLPDNLKAGLENMSGMSMDDVKVHYNSSKPAQMQAHAYAQGTNIHIATGQEKHLAHEAWHVVQQKQGRVKPTTFVNGAPVNDNISLEKEADVMGAKALNYG